MLAFSYCDKVTVKIMHNLFCTSNAINLIITMGHCPKQKGEKDCGLFYILLPQQYSVWFTPQQTQGWCEHIWWIMIIFWYKVTIHDCT